MPPTIALPPIEQKFGDKLIKIPTGEIYPPTMRTIAEKIGELKAPESWQFKIPMHEGESQRAWLERANELDNETCRRDGETVEAHTKRINTPKLEEVAFGLRIINAVGPMFGQSEVSQSEYDSVPWLKTSAFLYNLLTFCGAHEVARAYAPKSLL